MSELKISNRLSEKLLEARRIVFFTGAGISAESGIATFRGDGGIWNKFKPEELANFSAFMKNPDLVWEWYQYRRQIVYDTQPNAAHYAITEFEKFYTVTVVTQNVDNLHTRAGNTTVHELHGNIEKNYCISCKKRFDYQQFESGGGSPKCTCGGLIRPDIVWFGEYLPQEAFTAAEEAAKNCDILFSIGTSGVVYPAAGIPMLAHRMKRYTVEINVNSTEMSYIFDENYTGKAGQILPDILEFVKKNK
ncbi:MAG: NAD-dependent deacylase [Ignavibacteria bacterium]|nr:NAD-dependent deacylase [Ignavibacteria bacterium]